MSLSDSKIKVLRPTIPSACFKARWIIPSPDKIIENGIIEVENGQIKDISTSGVHKQATDLGDGVIIPALVNAHIHLELSALESALDLTKGFETWVQQLLIKRDALGEEKLKVAADKAAAAQADMGTGIVGEISTLGITRPSIEQNGLSGIWFQEVLGSSLMETDLKQNDSLSFSIAGHAPHTTDPEVLKKAKSKTADKGLKFSIHLAESEAESLFLGTGKGQWADFLASRGIDTTGWPIGNISPVKYLNRLGILDQNTLAVHLLRTEKKDFEVLAQKGTQVCLCPRSNQNLHGRLPDIDTMLEMGLEPALGTDSLASCASLSLFDEMAFVRDKYPSIGPETVFSMTTANGAKALGLEHTFGSLLPGKQALFAYVEMSEFKKSQILERLTWNEI